MSNEAQYKAILDATPDMIFRLNRSGQYLDFKGTGAPGEPSAAEVIGRTLWDVLDVEIADASLRAIHQTLESGQLQTCEYQLCKPDGYRDYEARIVVSGPDEVLAIVRDITERKHTEMQLRASADRDRLLATVAMKIRHSLDLNQILQTTADEALRFLGADRMLAIYLDCDPQSRILAEALAPGWNSCQDDPMNQDETLQQELEDLFQQGTVHVMEDTRHIDFTPNRAAFLERNHVRAALGLPIWLDNHLLGLLVAHQCRGPRRWQPQEIDLLEQLGTHVAIAIQQTSLYRQLAKLNANLEKQVEQRTAELQQRMQELQELNQLKDVFLHTVTHDLRTPAMGTLLVLNNLLQNAAPGSDKIPVPRSVLSRMIQGSEHQLKMINSLLEAQSGNLHGITLQCETVSLGHLVQTIVENLDALLAKNQASLSNQVSLDLPLIQADITQLKRVYENLIMNALKHNAPGIFLTLTARVQEKFLYCTVADNGVGIDPSELPHIFELYARGHRARYCTGIGLGLYLCRKIIESHGGDMGVSSQPGTGSQFWFTLPLNEQP